jgi:hypothetical protein
MHRNYCSKFAGEMFAVFAAHEFASGTKDPTPKVVIGDAVGGGLAHRSPLRSERRLCAEVQVNLEERSTASNAGNQELKNLAQNSFRQPCFAKDI